MNLLVMPAFFLSGGLFPLADAPKALQMIASIDPLSYGVDGLRAALIGVTHFGVATDLISLLPLRWCSLVSAAISFLKFNSDRVASVSCQEKAEFRFFSFWIFCNSFPRFVFYPCGIIDI